MNKELKAKWVAALRSGEYKQGSYFLHTSYDAYSDRRTTMYGHEGRKITAGGYCCLGVLAKISGVATDDYIDNECVLDYTVRTSLELNEATSTALIKQNDGDKGVRRKTFKQIAAWIERNL